MPPMIPHDTHLQIGSLVYEGLHQIDLTGPFEDFSRVPNSTYRIFGNRNTPLRLILAGFGFVSAAVAICRRRVRRR